MDEDKKLYWVRFVEQERGTNIDTYFIAKSLAHLEEEIADILEVKLINDVSDLT